MPERKLQLMLSWIEEHPEVVDQVMDRLTELAKRHEEVEASLKRLAPDVVQARKLEEARRTTFMKQVVTIATDVAPALSDLGKTIDEEASKTKEAQERVEGFTRRLGFLGVRLGWLGFRLVIMGKMITNWLLLPVRKTLNAMRDWESSIDTTAMSMGLLAATGQLTAERQDMMLETLMKGVELGPRLAASWGYLSASLLNLAYEAGPGLSDFFLDLGDLIRDLTPLIAQQIVPTITKLLDTFREWLPDLKDIALTALPAFMEGLSKSLPFMMGFLDAIKPLIGPLAELAGMLAPLAPLMIVLGTGIYFLSPVISVLSVGIDKLWKAFGTLIDLAHGGTVAIAGFQVGLVPLLAIVGAVIYVIAGLAAWWEELTEVYNTTIGPAVAKLGDAMGRLGDAIGIQVDWWDLLKMATTPVYIALKEIMTWVGKLIDGIATLIDWIAQLEERFGFIRGTIEAVNNIGGKFNDWVTGAEDVVKDFTEFICIPHTMMDIVKTTEQANRSLRDFQDEVRAGKGAVGMFTRGGAMGLGPGGGEVSQTIYIYPSITIGEVSGIGDLAMVYDTVTAAMGDELRRRGLRP